MQNNLTLKESINKIERTKDSIEDPVINEGNDLRSHPLGFAKTQFHENYIISETETGVIIVDQHAAHERIIYEKIKEDFYKENVKTQILLIPIVINIDPIISKNIGKRLNQFIRFGLKIENFGLNSLVVREIPAIISNCDIKKLVESLVHEMENEKDFKTLESQINKKSVLQWLVMVQSDQEENYKLMK